MIYIKSTKGQTIDLVPLYNTIGIKVTNISTEDSCKVEYKLSQSNIWQLGYPPDKISISNIEQFRGSVFNLAENTQYDVKVTLYEGASAKTLPIAQTTTLLSPDFNPKGDFKWVSPTGTGNYSQNNPGSLASLFLSGQITWRTTIDVKDVIENKKRLRVEDNQIYALTKSGICNEYTFLYHRFHPSVSIYFFLINSFNCSLFLLLLLLVLCLLVCFP